MNQFGITDKSYQLLMAAFLHYPEVEQAIVFGSRAKGNFKKGSDIDIAIKGVRCNEQTAMNIKAYLNEELPLPYYVDVVCYKELENKELKEHIDRVGKVLPAAQYKTLVSEPPTVYNTKQNKRGSQEG